MAEDEEDDLPSVDHGPLNEGPWEKEGEREDLDEEEVEKGATEEVFFTCT